MNDIELHNLDRELERAVESELEPIPFKKGDYKGPRPVTMLGELQRASELLTQLKAGLEALDPVMEKLRAMSDEIRDIIKQTGAQL